MRKNLSEIYSSMYNNTEEEIIKENNNRFLLEDYTKLVYGESNIFDYLDKLINEGSHGDEKIVRASLKDAYNKGLVRVKETKSGWMIFSKNTKDKLAIHKGEANYHYLRRFLDKIQGLTS